MNMIFSLPIEFYSLKKIGCKNVKLAGNEMQAESEENLNLWEKYRRRDLNSQDRSRRILSALRLPIPPRLRGDFYFTLQTTRLATLQADFT